MIQLNYLDNDEQNPDPRMGDYFVSAIDGERYSLVSGPYREHATALADVGVCRSICQRVDPRAAFYAFGTCRIEPGSGRIGMLQKHDLHEIME